MTSWFTADTHFGHRNIIRHCSRPFASVEEMDGELVACWNAVVRRDDDVYHLGDFAFRNSKVAASYAQRLNGRLHLIWGNHDPDQVRHGDWWASSQPYAEISVEGRRLVLFHYGLRVWNRSRHGAIHLYGHSHGALPGDGQSCDVGVDYPAWGYRPVRLEEIEAHISTLPPRRPADRHGEQR
jgi:calcineurin-like phosphoesterase family protein